MNPSKQKGTTFESAVVSMMKEYGWPNTERRALAGNTDKGDIISGPANWVFECKATREINLAAAVDEADRESINAGDSWFAAIIKRRNKPIDHAYVVMPLWEFLGLLKTMEKK